MVYYTDDKKMIRQHILAERGVQTVEKAACMAKKILGGEQFRKANSIFCYCAVAGEADTHAIIEAAWKDGKKVCVPHCCGNMMRAVLIESWDDLKYSGSFGIPEPSNDGAVVPATEIDLIIVPGLAFDGDGYRLGYGGGHYDRLLASSAAVTIGLCRAEYFFERLPREAHDMPVDCVITDG